MTEVPGGVCEFQPFIRYHTFAESSVNFTVILRAREFVDQYLVKHEFIKRLHARFRKLHRGVRRDRRRDCDHVVVRPLSIAILIGAERNAVIEDAQRSAAAPHQLPSTG